MPQSASGKDEEVGGRMEDQDDREKAATSRQPGHGNQHVQRPYDKNQLSRPVGQTGASAARRSGQTRGE